MKSEMKCLRCRKEMQFIGHDAGLIPTYVCIKCGLKHKTVRYGKI